MIHIVYGSASDKNYFKSGTEFLKENNLEFKEFIISSHRNRIGLNKYIDELNTGKIECDAIIGVAGLSAVMPGIIAASTTIPVIAVPVPKKYLSGIDSLISILQSPGGAPVVSVGLHEKAPLNAAMFAQRILRKALKKSKTKIQKLKIKCSKVRKFKVK